MRLKIGGNDEEAPAGTTLSGAELDEIPTRIVLLGILSADIVWQVGGTGPDAKPYTFKLENVINA